MPRRAAEGTLLGNRLQGDQMPQFERERDRLGWRQWGAAAIVGAALFLVGNTGVAWAELHVSTGVSSLVIATIPLWMAFFDRVACGQRLGRAALIGLGVGFAGAALL